MVPDAKFLMRVFSPSRISRALNSLDKSAGLIVGVCWLAALVMLVLAIYAVHGAVSSKREAATAMSTEPVLPTISNTPATPREIQLIIERLQRQFPDIKIETRQGQGQILAVTSSDGSKFHQWITALSYIDTMSPQYSWTLREFCAGACAGNQIMSAVVSGQRITLSAPSE